MYKAGDKIWTLFDDDSGTVPMEKQVEKTLEEMGMPRHCRLSGEIRAFFMPDLFPSLESLLEFLKANAKHYPH
jgi:hypothetical protein